MSSLKPDFAIFLRSEAVFFISVSSRACALVICVISSMSIRLAEVDSIPLLNSLFFFFMDLPKTFISKTSHGMHSKKKKNTDRSFVITMQSAVIMFIRIAGTEVIIWVEKVCTVSTSRISFDWILPLCISLWKVMESCWSFLTIAPRRPASTRLVALL